MTYKPVGGHAKMVREALKDPEMRALYEVTALQIEQLILLKKSRKKQKPKTKHKGRARG